jgi:DNA-binding IclR family transcriptional regulator
MVSRALGTLMEQGYVVRDESRTRYQLGHGVLDLHARAVELDIRALCEPALRRLHDLTGESVFLSIIVGRNHVTIDSVEAHGVKVSHNPPGLPVPLHASPASRVLLAFLGDAEIDEYIRLASPLKRFTATTLTDPAKLREEVQLVRRQRYAKGYGDHYTAGTYIAFPVLDSEERPHAAITVGGPRERFTQQRVDELLPAMLEIMEELNRKSRMHPVTSIVMFGT